MNPAPYKYSVYRKMTIGKQEASLKLSGKIYSWYENIMTINLNEKEWKEGAG
ncbi:MAG: hypothetical protein JW806_01400 [Sedimentisphaerales bacterium]|nr:hypothetical protein [Sedimentisphaerales bacterium]